MPRIESTMSALSHKRDVDSRSGSNVSRFAMAPVRKLHVKQENGQDKLLQTSSALHSSIQLSNKATSQSRSAANRRNVVSADGKQDGLKDESKASRLSAPTTSKDSSKNGDSAEKKAERIAKYKEERRKQLASKYGDWSSSEDITNIGEEPSYMRFSRRQRNNRPNNSKEAGSESSVVDGAVEKQNGISNKNDSPEKHNGVSNKNGNAFSEHQDRSPRKETALPPPSSLMERVPDPGGTDFDKIVRTNRASRLRALATNSSHQENGEFVRTGSLRIGGSHSDCADTSFLRSSPLRRSCNFSQHSSITSDANNGLVSKGLQQSPTSPTSQSSLTTTSSSCHSDANKEKFQLSPTQVKDKSGKRKSNLNRAMIVETPCSLTPNYDDSLPRYRKAKARNENGDKKSQESELAVEDQKNSSSPKSLSNGQLLKGDTNQTDDSKIQADTSVSKKPKSSPLKRPEIPEILRSRSQSATSGVHHESALVGQDRHSADSPNKHTISSAFKVCIEVKNEDVNAADRIRELTELVRETTVKVDNLTYAALNSDSDMGAKADKVASPAEETRPSLEVDQKAKTLTSQVNDVDNKEAENSLVTAIKVQPCHSKIFQPDVKPAERSYVEVKYRHSLSKNPESSQRVPIIETTNKEMQKRLQTKIGKDPECGVLNLTGKHGSVGEESESDDAYLTPAADIGDRSPESFRFSETFSSNRSSEQGESLIIIIKSDDNENPKQEKKNATAVDSKPLSILKRKSLESCSDIGSLSLLGHSEDLPSILRRYSDDPPKSGFEGSRLREASSEQECRVHSPISILRKKSSSDETDGKSHSILKHKTATFDTEERESSPEPHSILKRRYSSDDQEMLSLEPRPILKKKNSLEDLEPKPILKKKSSTEDELEERLKPILKSRCRSGSDDSSSSSSGGAELVLIRRSSRSSREDEHADEIKPILKARSSLDDKPASILKAPEPTSRLPSILKARSLDVEESFISAVRMHVDGKNEETTGSDSYESTAADVASASKPQPSEGDVEMETTEASLLSSEFPSLLPSILKKCSKEVHPLATPHSEIANFIKAQKSPEVDESKKSFSLDILEEGEAGPRLSVAERINQMEARLEEDKLKQCRSPWRSGQSTPCQRFRAGSTPPLRSGDCTPLQLDEFLQQIQEPISKDQLLMRLENVAQSNRRARYDRSSDRFRTQPITLEEMEDSNSLASVQKFRRLVITKASFDAFKQREKDEQEPRSPIDKPTEFPQPFLPVKSKEWVRHHRRTLPITVEELTDADKTGQKASSEESSGDDVLHLSVAAKASLFMQMEKGCPPVRRNRFRRGLQRSQTQPVTFEEFHEASKMADDSKADKTPKKALPQQQPREKLPLAKQNSVGMIPKMVPKKDIASDKTSSESEEDPCKLSLNERIKLFNRKVVEERLPALQKSESMKGINRKRNSLRYRTQPVTSEELEKALDLKKSTSLASIGEADGTNSHSVDDVRVPPIYEHEEFICNENIAEANEDVSDSGLLQLQQQVKTQADVIEFTQHIHIVSYPYEQPMSAIGESFGDSEIQIGVGLETEEPVQNGDEATAATLNSKCDGVRLRPSKELPKIKNDAINRRRNAALRRFDERRSACELSSSSSTSSSESCTIRKMHSVHHRSNTSPLTKLEIEQAKEITENNRKSIAERVAELQQSGEGWRKRVSESKDPDVQEWSKDSSSSSSSDEKMSKTEPSSFIENRKSLLAESQQEWKQRVEDCDAVQFTVAGKMGCTDDSLPVIERSKRKPTASIFRSKTDLRDLQTAIENGCLVVPGPTTLQRSQSMPSSPTKTVNNNNNNNNNNNKETKEETETAVKVIVPKADDESFQAFFSSSSVQSQKVEISEDVFQQVTSEKRELLIQKRTVRMQRRHVASKNPLRTLATRTDIQNEYVETKSGVAEKELKRINIQKLAKNTPSLAISALAGLASREDFTNVNLKKTASVTNTRLNPYKDLMLLQVKGRRHVQTRLVDPCITSINKGDNFILVTPSEVYNWIGEFSNVIERSRAAEVAAIIQSRKDLGCSCTSVITIDNEKKTGMSHATKFYKLLGGKEDDVEGAGSPKEDEAYENDIISTNMMYEVENDKLVPCSEMWGNIPKIETLDTKKVFVFDFGSEVYVWHGKLAPAELRKAGITLARELWEKGYDYSECHINPICPLLNDNVPKTGSQRPEWTLLAKLNQHMETILFREKFLDWPDASRVIKVKKQDSDEKITVSEELMPCDAKVMLESPVPEPDLVLEGTHIGRGNEYWDEKEKRRYNIDTLGIKVWQVSEFDHRMLPRESWGQFYSGDTYVVRWQFRVTVGGRDLSGQISRHSTTGRERCAYFFWQGKDSTINEKGASALMTVELDQERGPHVLVEQDHEPPCFISLFDGSMIIHRGKREAERRVVEESDSSSKEEETEEEEDEKDVSKPKCEWKLFALRGEQENETCLIEIVPSMAALRSRGCLLLVNTCKGTIYVWHGAKASTQINELALSVAETVQCKRPREIGFDQYATIKMKDINEGSETTEFVNGLGGGRSKLYYSLKESSMKFDFTPRLFHMTSVSGTFKALEIPYPLYSSSMVCPFPFMQSYLYKAAQPALFMLDNQREVYLWQGWWPEATDDNENLATGSAKVRWNVDRRCAMMTTINYCQEKNKKSPPPAYLVSAGLEPLSFTNIFPEWEVMDEMSSMNAKDGKRSGEQPLVKDVLARLTRTRYTLKELQSTPRPEGVDPSRLESYLDDDDFQELLHMDRKEFYSLQSWKQKNVKQEAGLY